MAAENRVSISITPEDQAAINSAILDIKTRLTPYLVSLTPGERQEIPKMKDKTVAFVTKTLTYAVSNPEFSPPFMKVDELNKDIAAINILEALFKPLQQITTGLDDTIMEAGSEAYISALSYYNSVKQAAKMNVPNAKLIYDDLKERFVQQYVKAVPVPA